MELILIDQRKLKIMLTPPDMAHYALLPEKLEERGYGDPQTRAAFRHIFDDAEAQTGFRTSGERLLVQLFTSKSGGCELFLTRLAKEAPHRETERSLLTEGEAALLRSILETEEEIPWEGGRVLLEDHKNRKASGAETKSCCPSADAVPRRVILSVESLSALTRVCRRLGEVGYDGKSHAYTEAGHKTPTYHLYLELPDGIFTQLPEAYAFLREYGSVSRSRYSELYLLEHGQLLRENDAVAVLGRLT